MKTIVTIILFFAGTILYAQNVGINKPSPNQPLDVNGNVNVDGKILINGVQGTNGQVLATGPSGSTIWANTNNYTYVSSFTQNGTFTVPVGITRILVEAWAAGGGGSGGGGGAAGEYIISVEDVTPGQLLTVNTGTGGAGASIGVSATDGGNTTITGSSPFINLTAAGGKGAQINSPGYAIRFGVSGGVYVQYTGQSGNANSFTYAQKNSGTFAIIRKYGDGGASGPDYSKKNDGQTISYNESSLVVIESTLSTFAPFPGGGGGGGNPGQAGGNGMVNFWY